MFQLFCLSSLRVVVRIPSNAALRKSRANDRVPPPAYPLILDKRQCKRPRYQPPYERNS